MDAIENEETATFAIPIEGLSTPRGFSVGPVTFFPSADDLPFLEPENRNEEFDKWIARPADPYRAVAVVEGASIDIALDTIEQALHVFRVFQYGLMRVAHYTHFGLPGEVHSGKIVFFHKGTTRSGMGFKVTGLFLGFELQETGIDSWENHAEPLQLAASAINNDAASNGAKRALNGIQLFSQSILAKDPDLRVLLVLAGLEGMLKPDGERSRTLMLSRKLSYLSCWQSGGCGHFDGQPCPYILFNPALDEDRRLLIKLGRMARANTRWKCTYWEVVNTWYETRSGIAHGQPEGTDPNEAAHFAYWSYHQYVDPTLNWLMNHPDSPVGDLEIAMSALRADGIDWRDVVKNGRMPNTSEESESEVQ